MPTPDTAKLTATLYDLTSDFQEAVARTQIATLVSHHVCSDLASHTGHDLYINLCALDRNHFPESAPDSDPLNHIDRRRLRGNGVTEEELAEEDPAFNYPEFVSAFTALSRWTRAGRRPRFDMGREALYLGVVSLAASLEVLFERAEAAFPRSVRDGWWSSVKDLANKRTKGTNLTKLAKAPLWIRVEGFIQASTPALRGSLFEISEAERDTIFQLVETRHCIAHKSGLATDKLMKRCPDVPIDEAGYIDLSAADFALHCDTLRPVAESIPAGAAYLSLVRQRDK